MKVVGIIPARYASSRFPGKPLALLGDKAIIRMVYEQASEALDDVYVATDDKRIEKAVKGFGGKVLMTSDQHKSGTDRCIEALEHLLTSGVDPDIVINIQGDEPFIKPQQIELLIDTFKDGEVKISTLIKKIDQKDDLFDPNIVKVVRSEKSNALYFSRQAIPFIRDQKPDSWLDFHDFYKHIGIYGYRASTLLELGKYDSTELENSESLEQLRWLQNGLEIRTSISKWDSIGIDTPSDLENAKVMLKGE